MTRRSALWISLCLWASLANGASAAKVKVWHHNTAAHHDKAQLKQAVVSNEGAVRLGRQLKPLAAVDAMHVWDIVEDRHGNLFVATGDEGKLYRITPEGKASVVFDSEDSQVLCLALAPDGSVYAGTGPSGLIVRVDPRGNAKVVYDSPEFYVWSLAFDADGKNLYAGTGPKGRIYQVTPEGKASVFYTTKQEHILCLARGGGGLTYAGTDKNGLVYRIDRHGKGFVLFQAPQAEVRSLLVTADGGVYAGTSAPTRRSVSGGAGSAGVSSLVAMNTSSPQSDGTTEAKAGARTVSAPPAKEKAKEKEEPKESDTGKGSPASAPSTPAAGENSLFRINPDGSVREVFREKALLLSLLRQDDRLFVGTGMQGQLFEINEATKERSEIARLDHGQIHCLLRRRDGTIVLGTGDPGKLYALQDQYVDRGTVVSDVLDAKLISKWGALRWQADTPAGTKVSVAVRTGNLAEPDETWSDWAAEQTDPATAVVDAPAARYLQYRVTLTTDDPAITPALRGLTLRYATTNQAPEVTGIETPDLNAVVLKDPKKLKLKWTATDANEDELTYHLYVRKEGWKSWVLLEDDLEKTEFDWDTTTTPAGIYHVKVVASDGKDNSAEEALAGERVSGPVTVAHTPPAVSVKVVGMDGDRAVLQAAATDPLVRLTGAQFAVNGRKWRNLFPSDGLFDAKAETFEFKTAALKPGSYVVVVRVKDAAGNCGSGDVVFTVQARTGK